MLNDSEVKDLLSRSQTLNVRGGVPQTIKDPPQPALHIVCILYAPILFSVLYLKFLATTKVIIYSRYYQIKGGIVQRVESPRAESRGWNCEGRIADG